MQRRDEILETALPWLTTLACALTLVSCGAIRGARGDDGAEPRLFAPHLWDEGEEVHGGTFTGDGRSFYFFTKVGAEDFRIVVSHWEDGNWRVPERVSFSDTTSDLYPAVSADGRRIVFTSYRRVPGDSSTHPNAHLWMVERVGDAWSEPQFLHGISSVGDYHPGVKMLRDGTLYFRVISRQDRATYRAPFMNGTYPRRERVTAYDALQSDSVRVWGAEPGPDDHHLFLTVARLVQAPEDFGPADIYVVRREHNGWSTPQPLPGIVNTEASEGAVTVTPDGRYLIFSRDGRLFQVALETLQLE